MRSARSKSIRRTAQKRLTKKLLTIFSLLAVSLFLVYRSVSTYQAIKGLPRYERLGRTTQIK